MPRDEYYEWLKEAHAKVDWNNRDSIRAYNAYARELRKSMEEGEDA